MRLHNCKVREDNPIGRLIQGSRVFFKTLTPVTFDQLNADQLSAISNRVCRLTISSDMHGKGAVSFEAPHEGMDAYAGLALLKYLNVVPQTVSKRDEGVVSGHFASYDYLHAWKPSRGIKRGNSLVQQLLVKVSSDGQLANDSVLGVAVSLEASWETPFDRMQGNGFVVVNFSLDSLPLISKLSPTCFRAMLRLKAQKVLRLLRRGALKSECAKQVLFSSLGRLECVAQAPRLSPSQLLMVSTPTRSDCTNIVTWSFDGIQGLTVVAHPCNTFARSAYEAWHSLVSKDGEEDAYTFESPGITCSRQ